MSEAQEKLLRYLSLLAFLAALGVSEAELAGLVADTFQSRNIPLNPRRPEPEAVAELFRRAIAGQPLAAKASHRPRRPDQGGEEWNDGKGGP